VTLKNYGFSDAAEFFVFISGYLAASSRPDHSWGPLYRRSQAAVDTRLADVRCPHHAVPGLPAQIARTVRRFDNPMYTDEFNVHNFFSSTPTS
jgi:hypothetical protein